MMHRWRLLIPQRLLHLPSLVVTTSTMMGSLHSTTSIFIGNLDPSVTEEMLTDLFRQFGDLYSVKIMWPRTAEGRARGHNTEFVCFMDREDAADATDAIQNTDCFHNGRRILP
jgi:U2-associated protein SR140